MFKDSDGDVSFLCLTRPTGSRLSVDTVCHLWNSQRPETQDKDRRHKEDVSETVGDPVSLWEFIYIANA